MKTIDQELLKDLPNLEVFKDGELQYYCIDNIDNDSVVIHNLDDKSDEWYFLLPHLQQKMDFGTIINYKDLKQDLQEVFLNQEIINYQTEKRINSW